MLPLLFGTNLGDVLEELQWNTQQPTDISLSLQVSFPIRCLYPNFNSISFSLDLYVFLASWCFMPIFWVKESTMVWLNSCVKIKFLLLKTRTLVVTPHVMLFQKWHTMFSFDPQPFSSCFYVSAPRYGDQGALLLRLDLTSWDAAFRRVPTCFWFSQGQRKGSISHLNHVAISDISDG